MLNELSLLQPSKDVTSLWDLHCFMDCSKKMTSLQHVIVFQKEQLVKSLTSLAAGILHGAGLSQHPKQRYPPSDQHAEQAPNSHVKYVW